VYSRRDFLIRSVAAGGVVSSAGGRFGVALPSPASAEDERAPAQSRKEEPQAMLVATMSPAAIRSGVEVMRRGGSAADAVLTTALSQIARCAGCWVSYAGRMTAVYFDAESGRVHALNACYDAPRNENDPQSIPRQPTPSGRTVLVPGFMAGVSALHERHGKLSFSDLFQPAIAVAQDGIPLSRQMANLIRGKSTVLTRFATGRTVFTKDGQQLVDAGDLFRQPQLAKTLTGVATHGAAYMYQGEWAEKFVRAVRAESGKITLDDLARYQPTWTEPLQTQLGDGIRVCAIPSPNRGGPLALACLNLANHAQLHEHGHFTESVESLDRILRIEEASRVIARVRGRRLLADHLGEDELTIDDFADPRIGRRLWRTIQTPAWSQIIDRLNTRLPATSEHSDAVVAVDRAGNVAAILHTINTAGWGTTGLFVEGVSIPDSGAAQQAAIAEAGPGGRIADYGPPMIAMKDGVPILAGSATGSGNVYASWQNFVNVLQYRMNPQEAADTANFYRGTFERASLKQAFVAQARDAGIALKLKSRFGGYEMGFWCGLGIDAETRGVQAGKIRKLDGIAVGF